MKIFVVSGLTGEYSDRSEWLVCAYAGTSYRVVETELCEAVPA